MARRLFETWRLLKEMWYYYDKKNVSRNRQRFEVNSEHLGPISIVVIMKKLSSNFRLKVFRNKYKEK